MRALNHSRQIPDLAPQPQLELNHSQAIADQIEDLAAVDSNLDIAQDLAFVSSIKAELERVGLLTPTANQDQELQIANLARILQLGFQHKLATAAQANFDSEQQNLLAIVALMQQAPDLDTLFQTTVIELHKYLQLDRAIIYRFQDQQQGIVLAESLTSGYTPSQGQTLAAEIFKPEAGRGYQQQVTAVDNVYQQKFSPYQFQLLQHFQVKASLNLPLIVAGQVWGILAGQQCDSARQWQAADISLLYQVGKELSSRLQQAQLQFQMQRQAEQEQLIAKVIEKIQRSPDVNAIFRTATQELRQLLQADRTVIYRFHPDWSGEFVAESVVAGWVAVLEQQQQEPVLTADRISAERCHIKDMAAPTTQDTDTYLQVTQGGGYSRGDRYKRVDDIYAAGFSACYLESLEKYQVRAYAIVPIFQEAKLWGLLGAYQNSGPRHWEDTEVNLMLRLSTSLSIALQQAEVRAQLQAKADQIAQAAERERAVTRVIDKIRQSLNLDSVFSATTLELRQLLQADRVLLYRFNPDWSGEVVAESVAAGWIPLLKEQQRDPSLTNRDRVSSERCSVPDLAVPSSFGNDSHIKATKGGVYARGEKFIRVDDIYAAEFSPCYMESLEKYQVRAYIIVPIFQGEKLWGLFAVYQNSGPRHWEAGEVEIMLQVSRPLGIAIQQAEFLQQIRDSSAQLEKTAAREQALTRLTSKLLRSLGIDAIFKTSTQELRQTLHSDRIALYKFNPDWSGQFVAESVAVGWSRVLDVTPTITDSQLQATQGGKYRQNETLVVNDIYTAAHEAEQVELLEQIEAKAYAIAPIFVNQQLWGLLGAYQNSAPRDWEAGEVNLLVQVATQVGFALQQSQYLEQLQQQSQQLAAAAAREKTAKEQLQQRAVQLLLAVRPALEGDLTVRAPITDDEVGTIADAYNNTLQSLRKIVLQLQQASTQVAQTSETSGSSMSELAAQAQQQFQALNQAVEQIQAMANSTAVVANDAQQVELAAQRTNQTVQQGDAAMNRTVEAILEIRGTVTETSKRLKRLSASSQKISKVVSLISNFTTQTQLLALNAAIEATRAGEYGRGFTVVADEVRSLARQSAAATTEISQLVQEIQTNTTEVSTAMDTGINQVVEGTNLVNAARQQLNAIAEATAEISQLVEGITQATQVQTLQSQSVTQTMTAVATIASQTSADSTDLSAACNELLLMAQHLQASANQFKVD